MHCAQRVCACECVCKRVYVCTIKTYPIPGQTHARKTRSPTSLAHTHIHTFSMLNDACLSTSARAHCILKCAQSVDTEILRHTHRTQLSLINYDTATTTTNVADGRDACPCIVASYMRGASALSSVRSHTYARRSLWMMMMARTTVASQMMNDLRLTVKARIALYRFLLR